MQSVVGSERSSVDLNGQSSVDGNEQSLKERAAVHLRALVGSDSATLRDDQWTAIDALVAQRRRALVVQRTGWGKSAVYFVATALLREQGAGPTVIISPLLALMRNQIAAAERAGIRAVTINSANAEQWRTVYDEVRAGAVDVLLVSPERLNNPGFRDEVLPQVAATAGLVVIDEAHCISDWGHDFRPDYRRIRTLLEDLPEGIPVLATTATANKRVALDVAEQLAVSAIGVSGPASGAGGGDAGVDPGGTLVLRGTLDRESLHLGVVVLPDQPSRLGWLADYLTRTDGSGIVYCLTVAATEQVADHLRSRGLTVAAYSGRTDPTERAQAEDDLLAGRVKALVATSALGMGFDKPDLAFVIHLGAPPSPIAYYQQVGRAGRAVRRAEVVLLPGTDDVDIWNYFGSLGFPAESDVRATLEELGSAGRPLSLPALEPRVSLRRSRLEMMLKVLDVDGAVRRVTGGWTVTGEPWAYDADRYARVSAAREVEQQAMLEYIRTSACRMSFLREQLDDPAPEPCGRCDNCGGLTLPAVADQRSVLAARAELDVPGVPVEPRGQWPSAMSSLGVKLTGRIPAGEKAESGRAVGRLDGIGWGSALRELLQTGAPDREVPVPLRHAVVKVLDGWIPPAAPADEGSPADRSPTAASSTAVPAIDAVVYIESVSRPNLVRHLATGLARYRGLPLATSFEVVDHRPAVSGTNSARRLAAVLARHQLLDPAAVVGKRVLLVDDATDTGWTLAVAARELRLAGATAVYPLVLAIR
jgi:ATP-dependent DNA helicase RecQ